MIRTSILYVLLMLPLTSFAFTSTNYTAHYAAKTVKANGIQEKKFSCQGSSCAIENNMVVKVFFKTVTINTLDTGMLNSEGDYVSSSLVITDSREDAPTTVTLKEDEYSILGFTYELRKELADNENLASMQVYFNGDVQTFTPSVISTDETFETDNGSVTTTHIQVDTSSGGTMDFHFDAARQNLMVGNTVTNSDSEVQLATQLTSVEFS